MDAKAIAKHTQKQMEKIAKETSATGNAKLVSINDNGTVTLREPNGRVHSNISVNVDQSWGENTYLTYIRNGSTWTILGVSTEQRG